MGIFSDLHNQLLPGLEQAKQQADQAEAQAKIGYDAILPQFLAAKAAYDAARAAANKATYALHRENVLAAVRTCTFAGDYPSPVDNIYEAFRVAPSTQTLMWDALLKGANPTYTGWGVFPPDQSKAPAGMSLQEQQEAIGFYWQNQRLGEVRAPLWGWLYAFACSLSDEPWKLYDPVAKAAIDPRVSQAQSRIWITVPPAGLNSFDFLRFAFGIYR